jgi:hypothetical protein
MPENYAYDNYAEESEYDAMYPVEARKVKAASLVNSDLDFYEVSSGTKPYEEIFISELKNGNYNELDIARILKLDDKLKELQDSDTENQGFEMGDVLIDVKENPQDYIDDAKYSEIEKYMKEKGWTLYNQENGSERIAIKVTGQKIEANNQSLVPCMYTIYNIVKHL